MVSASGALSSRSFDVTFQKVVNAAGPTPTADAVTTANVRQETVRVRMAHARSVHAARRCATATHALARDAHTTRNERHTVEYRDCR